MRRLFIAAALAIASCCASYAQTIDLGPKIDTKLTFLSGGSSAVSTHNPCAVGFGVNAGAVIATGGITYVWSAKWCRMLLIYQATCPLSTKPSGDCAGLRAQLIEQEFETRPALPASNSARASADRTYESGR